MTETTGCHYSPLQPGLHKVDSGASAASGQTQISWTSFDKNHVYFVQALHGKCTKMYLTQTKIAHDRHKAVVLAYMGLNDALYAKMPFSCIAVQLNPSIYGVLLRVSQ